MVLVFEQLIDRPKAEQWVDMVSKSFQESASKAHVISIFEVGDKSFQLQLSTVPHKFGIAKISNSTTFVLHMVTVQRHMDDSIKNTD